MKLPIFKLEEYLSLHEFSAPLLLCCSDAESFSMKEILHMAKPHERALWDNLTLAYTESQGLPALREMIRKQLYPGLKSDQHILTFSGAEEGIFCALYSMVGPGDHVIVLSPNYQSLSEIPKIKGASVTQVSLREENLWRIDIKDIKDAIRPNTKLLIMNFPHNPTGSIIEEKDLLDIISLCRHHDFWLFSDEVYRLLGKPDAGWSRPAAVVYEKALSLGVMSKAFGMAGLRIGWLACQDDKMLAKIRQVKYYTSICCSGPSEIISLIALDNKDAVLDRNNEIIAKNLSLLDHFMAEHSELFEWVRPQGGCVGFVKYQGKESVEHFSMRLLKEKGVLVMPASIFVANSNHFRIGFGRKNMPAALLGLREFVQA